MRGRRRSVVALPGDDASTSGARCSRDRLRSGLDERTCLVVRRRRATSAHGRRGGGARTRYGGTARVRTTRSGRRWRQHRRRSRYRERRERARGGCCPHQDRDRRRRGRDRCSSRSPCAHNGGNCTRGSDQRGQQQRVSRAIRRKCVARTFNLKGAVGHGGSRAGIRGQLPSTGWRCGRRRDRRRRRRRHRRC